VQLTCQRCGTSYDEPGVQEADKLCPRCEMLGVEARVPLPWVVAMVGAICGLAGIVSDYFPAAAGAGLVGLFCASVLALRYRRSRQRVLLAMLVPVGLAASYNTVTAATLELKSNVECRDSWDCRHFGQCSARLWDCVVESSEDCQGSSLCRRDGRCTRGERGYCVAGSNSDCQQSKGCRIEGQCTAVLGGCSAASAQDCEGSDICRYEGACSLSDGGYCSAQRDEDCLRSIVCQKAGRCSVSGVSCVVASDADCKASNACRNGGRCRASQGSCSE